jgi:hypothetical protein
MGWPTNPRPAKCLLTLRDQVDNNYPGRSTASDGMIGDLAHQKEGSASDHNPWLHDSRGVGVVTAIDITHDPAHGLVIAHLAHKLAKSRDHRIKYIITNRRILDSRPEFHPWVWMPYSGADPHTGHLHLSVVTAESRYDDTRPWAALEDWFDMANKHDLEAVIREMLPDITKAVKKGVAEQLNAGPIRDEIRGLVSQAVNDDLKTVIGATADTTLTGIADQIAHLNELLTAPPTAPTATGTRTTPPAEDGTGTTLPAEGSRAQPVQ